MEKIISCEKDNSPEPVAGIVLAAGMSKRLGIPKQLLKVNDKYLLHRVVESAVCSALEKIYLVLGCGVDDILDKLPFLKEDDNIEILYNPDYALGMSSSLKKGLVAAKDKYASVMFLLGDQPFLSSTIINYLLNQYHASQKEICVPLYKGFQKNPVIFSETLFNLLMDISGDRGGRQIIQENSERVLQVPMDEALPFFDIDNPEDIVKLRDMYGIDVV